MAAEYPTLAAAYSTYTSGAVTATSHTIPYPAGTKNGDWLFMAMSSRVIVGITANPTSWNGNYISGNNAGRSGVWLWTHQVVDAAETQVVLTHHAGTLPLARSLGAIMVRVPQESVNRINHDGNDIFGPQPTDRFREHQPNGDSTQMNFISNPQTAPFTVTPATADPNWYAFYNPVKTDPQSVKALWFLAVVLNPSTNALPAPAGWTLVAQVLNTEIGEQSRLGLYWKQEDSTGVTFPSFTGSVAPARAHTTGGGFAILDNTPGYEITLRARGNRVKVQELPYMIDTKMNGPR